MAYIKDDEGNYKRTIRCGWCYTVGHSTRTCPEKYPDGTPAQKRAATKKAAKLAEQAANGGRAPQRCSYCKEAGHQRRKCDTLEQDKKLVIDVAVDYRRRACEQVERDGIAVGALIKWEESEYSNTTGRYEDTARYSIVTKIDSDHLSPVHNSYIGKREDVEGPASEPMNHVLVSGQYAGQSIGTGFPASRDHRVGHDQDEDFANWAGRNFTQYAATSHKVICAGDTTKIKEELLDENRAMALVETHFKKNKPREFFQILDRITWIEGYKSTIAEQEEKEK
jgi:hypothetical protein